MRSAFEKFIEVVTFVVEVFERFFDDHCPQMAAALAYYTIFSIPPFLVIVIMTTGTIVEPERIQSMLEGSAARFISPRGAQQIVALARGAAGWAREGPWWSIGLSAVGLLFGATRAFAQLQTALNRAWAIPDKHRNNLVRQFVAKRFMSFLTIGAMIVLLLALLLLRAFVERFGRDIALVAPSYLMTILDWISGTSLSLVAGTAIFAFIYRVLPDASITWSQVLPGAIVTAFLFEGTKSLVAFYLGRVQADVFGQAASFAVLMIWLYVGALILFLGAELTEVWTRKKGRPVGTGEKRGRPATFAENIRRRLEDRLLTS